MLGRALTSLSGMVWGNFWKVPEPPDQEVSASGWAAAGPVAAAGLADLTGNYTLLYLSMAAVVLLGLALQLAAGRPRRGTAG